MGLDIRVYRRITKIADWPENIESIDDIAEYKDGAYYLDGQEVMAIYPDMDRGFPEHGAPAPGLYTYQGQDGGRAGSYSGYGDWRNWLSMARFGVAAERVWDKFTRYRQHGAAWLINFSDAEGYIGAAVARRILDDLRAHEETLRADARSDYDNNRLDNWLRWLSVAADDGVIDFH